MHKEKKGFTLIEMAIILIIIGVIAGILGPAIFKMVAREKRSAADRHMHAMADRIAGYTIVNGALPMDNFLATYPDKWGTAYRLEMENTLQATPDHDTFCATNGTSLVLATIDGDIADIAIFLSSNGEDHIADISEPTNDRFDVTDKGDDLYVAVPLLQLQNMVCQGL